MHAYVKTLVCIWVKLQPGGFLPFLVRCLINAGVFFLCVCVWIHLSSAEAWEFSQGQLKSSGAAWKGSRDREDGVCQISLRSDWVDWNWSVCGHIVCMRRSERMSDYVCALIGRVVSLQVEETSYCTIWVMGTCSPKVSIGHLFTHQPPNTHTHTNTRGCSVTWCFSQLLCFPVSTPPLEQINTTCFCQLLYSYTCLNLYLRHRGPLVPHFVLHSCL